MRRVGFRSEEDEEETESMGDSVITETTAPEAFLEFSIYGLLPSLLTFLVLVIFYIRKYEHLLRQVVKG